MKKSVEFSYSALKKTPYNEGSDGSNVGRLEKYRTNTYRGFTEQQPEKVDGEAYPFKIPSFNHDPSSQKDQNVGPNHHTSLVSSPVSFLIHTESSLFSQEKKNTSDFQAYSKCDH